MWRKNLVGVLVTVALFLLVGILLTNCGDNPITKPTATVTFDTTVAEGVNIQELTYTAERHSWKVTNHSKDTVYLSWFERNGEAIQWGTGLKAIWQLPPDSTREGATQENMQSSFFVRTGCIKEWYVPIPYK
jgi:hypothetical protein